MRLVTWNAARGKFAAKAPLLSELDGDIAVIQEVAPPVDADPRILWFGSGQQGVAVIAREPYRITPLPVIEGVPSYVVPVAVDGPSGEFVLFAVWTIDSKPLQYVRSLATAIDLYSEIFRSKSAVVAGDFNSNAIWDTRHPAHLNHSSVVSRLKGHGLISAYHHLRDENHGEESEKTFHLYRHEDKAYHIDYCFLPAAWSDRLSRAEIGLYEDWRVHSDHRPLLVELID
jgi:exonuclease III